MGSGLILEGCGVRQVTGGWVEVVEAEGTSVAREGLAGKVT